MGLIFQSVPAGAVQTVPEAEREVYFDALVRLPQNVQDLLFSARTGSYIQGFAKTYDIPESAAPLIAFTVLRIGIGEITLARLGATLSSELGVANDVAQKMAAELEHDLFAPVAGELSQYLATRKQQVVSSAATAASDAGATNILDLKSKPKPPIPPPIPRPPSVPRPLQ